MPTHIMAPANQKMLPSKLKLVVRETVGGLLEKQRGLAVPQRAVTVKEYIQLMKDLATTIFPPRPTTGMKLNAQPTQQAIPHPGSAGGLATTFSHLLITQFTNTFLKMKYPMRQQNYTSVYPTIKITLTEQPSMRKWMAEKKFLTLCSTLLPRKRTMEYIKISKAGQRQKARKRALQYESFQRQMLQSLGSKSTQTTQRVAISNKGIKVLRIASFTLERPALFTMATMRVRMINIPKKIHSPQKDLAQIVIRMSPASSRTNSPTQVPILSPLLCCQLVRLRAQRANGAFQSTHPYTSPMAIARVSVGTSGENMVIESAYMVVSTYGLTVILLAQQQEYCLLTAKQSTAHTPTLTAIAIIKQTQCKRYPLVDCQSCTPSLADSIYADL